MLELLVSKVALSYNKLISTWINERRECFI